jgi:hypothetical protein
MKVDMSAQAIASRVQAVSAQSDLRVGRRLLTKVDLSAAGIERRIRAASEMLDLCRSLQRVGHTARRRPAP